MGEEEIIQKKKEKLPLVTVSYKSHFFTIMVVVLCFRN
jgi:hypothetical protein